MTDRLDPAAQPWMNEQSTRAVFAALTSKGGEARFVGGAVRNALLGKTVTDVDIATTLGPEDVMRRLEQHRIEAIPTGVEHGTVTAVAQGKRFEITTLRRDVATDGRRATVAFTSNWAEDAARRDFTMNAIYASADGTLFDPTGGIADLRAGRVRFVGDAAERISEDYLRILRFFRFHAWYGRGEPDEAALAAAAAGKAGLRILSGERVQKEIVQLLQAREPMPVLRAMQTHGILDAIFTERTMLERLENLIDISNTHGLAADPVRMLAALMPSEEAARAAATRLKLSNAGRERLIAVATGDVALSPSLPPAEAGRLLYRMGAERFCDHLLLRWAKQPENPVWGRLFAFAADWRKPEFPVDGNDAIAAGATEGPELGRALAALERWWVERDFAPGRAELLAKLKELIEGQA